MRINDVFKLSVFRYMIKLNNMMSTYEWYANAANNANKLLAPLA